MDPSFYTQKSSMAELFRVTREISHMVCRTASREAVHLSQGILARRQQTRPSEQLSCSSHVKFAFDVFLFYPLIETILIADQGCLLNLTIALVKCKCHKENNRRILARSLPLKRAVI